jgi:7-cyano-7-deazaguanine reductase
MENPLGKKSEFPAQYCPEVLYRVLRNRSDLGGTQFHGFDRWICYELSWLDTNGTPQAGIAELMVSADSRYIVESKSLKLYLGSFSFERIDCAESLAARVMQELSTLLESKGLTFQVFPLDAAFATTIGTPFGRCIDGHIAATTPDMVPSHNLLRCTDEKRSETLFSNLFRSLCPVTAQPDFASVEICYTGSKIVEQSLLQYLCSFRNAAGFHEHCCEQIFHDLTRVCRPSELTVTCNFTRRGGIEINPVRASSAAASLRAAQQHRRHVRQ